MLILGKTRISMLNDPEFGTSANDQPESPTVKSARRVLEVLEFFAQGAEAATVTQIATALVYPQSSTSVLLSSLNTLGYLRFDAIRRTYAPTLRVMLLGSRLQDELFGQGSLVSEMERLRQRTRQTVMIGLQQGIYVRFIFSLQGIDAHSLLYPVGVLRPICRSAVGKILLSRLSNRRIIDIGRRANALATTPEDRVDIKELIHEITSIRQQGWARSIDYPLPNRASLAVELPELREQPPMALIVGSRKSLMLEKHEVFLAELRHTTARLGIRA